MCHHSGTSLPVPPPTLNPLEVNISGWDNCRGLWGCWLGFPSQDILQHTPHKGKQHCCDKGSHMPKCQWTTVALESSSVGHIGVHWHWVWGSLADNNTIDYGGAGCDGVWQMMVAQTTGSLDVMEFGRPVWWYWIRWSLPELSVQEPSGL